MDTDLDGNASLEMALKQIKGINFRLSRAVSSVSGVDSSKPLKEISEDQIKKIEAIIRDPVNAGIPVWMLNRRKDMETGKDIHLVSNDLDLTKKLDIDIMKKIKSWKGVRHIQGQPVRGQRTRSSFRVSGMVIGVSRKAVKAAAAPAPAEAAATAAPGKPGAPVLGKLGATAPAASGAKPAAVKPGVASAAKPTAAPAAKPAAKPAKPEAKK